MKAPPEAAVQRRPTDLQQLVQRLADDYQSKNDRVSHELYENIAQSLAAVKTQLALLEKQKPPDEQPTLADNYHQLDTILQAALEKIRALADGLYAPALSNLGLGAGLEALCQCYSDRTHRRVRFESRLGVEGPPWIGRRHAICLHYFVEQALGSVAPPDSPVSVYLDGGLDEISVTVSFVASVSAPMPLANLEQEKTLTLLQEWLRVWGGRLDYVRLSGQGAGLTAWLGAGQGA